MPAEEVEGRVSGVARRVSGVRAGGDWKQEKGNDHLDVALKRFKNIDLVCAHNAPTACGAYLAARDTGRVKE